MSPARQRRTPLAVVATPQPSYKVADVAEVEQAAAEMSKNTLECRDFGHTWTTANIVRKDGVFLRWLWCKRCKTNRRQTLSMSGEILASDYEYTPDYLLKGMGRMLADGRDALRRESLERAASKGQIQEGTDEDPFTVPARALRQQSA